MAMEITRVQIKIMNNENRLRALASVTFDEAFVVHEIKLIEGANGLFVAMPSTKGRFGFHDIAHPINTQTREEIDKACVEAYNSAIQNYNKQEESTNIEE